MSTFIDSHVHIYGSYAVDRVFGSMERRTCALGASCGVMMLTEREGMDVFHTIQSTLPQGWNIFRAEDALLCMRSPRGSAICVVAGRQIACAERIEVLSLGTLRTFRDGSALRDVIADSIAVNAVATVLAWGVGKWLGTRATIVEGVLKQFSPSELALGDTSLRPYGWGEPIPMRRERAAGRVVLHGSDPLPSKREETRAGIYGDLFLENINFDESVLPQIRAMLSSGEARPAGRRNFPLDFALRMIGR